MRVQELHNHPVTEMREGIPKNKVLVDPEFAHLFRKTWDYWDNYHVIVRRSEYESIKNKPDTSMSKQKFLCNIGILKNKGKYVYNTSFNWWNPLTYIYLLFAIPVGFIRELLTIKTI